MARHAAAQVDPLLVDQAKPGEAVRRGRTCLLHFPFALGPEIAASVLDIVADKAALGRTDVSGRKATRLV